MKPLYDKIVGTGGVGTGLLFISDNNETLGRNESRLARLSGAKDYCKLHIVFHYIAVLLAGQAEVYPVSYVGGDPNGEKLCNEMRRAGMFTDFIGKSGSLPTMLSICLQYPDKSGCNVTASNSACDLVLPEYITGCLDRIGVDNRTILAAIPEVRLESRAAMLRFGRAKGAFCVLTLTAGEAEEARRLGVLRYCDLLAVNKEEAEAVCGASGSDESAVDALAKHLAKEHPGMKVLVTCGKAGAYSICEENIEYIPPLPAGAVNTTGAGDAFLGGTISAIARGYPFQKGAEDTVFGQTPLKCAPELGAICAGMAVESEDSIAAAVTMKNIAQRIKKAGWERAEWFAT